MAKWFGKVGYMDNVETVPGVWGPSIIEREYFGDSYSNSRKLQSSGEVNDTVVVSNRISILSDPYALNHFHSIRYATLYDVPWKVTDVEVQYPRLVLTLGGVWNGGSPGTSS